MWTVRLVLITKLTWVPTNTQEPISSLMLFFIYPFMYDISTCATITMPSSWPNTS